MICTERWPISASPSECTCFLDLATQGAVHHRGSHESAPWQDTVHGCCLHFDKERTQRANDKYFFSSGRRSRVLRPSAASEPTNSTLVLRPSAGGPPAVGRCRRSNPKSTQHPCVRSLFKMETCLRGHARGHTGVCPSLFLQQRNLTQSVRLWNRACTLKMENIITLYTIKRTGICWFAEIEEAPGNRPNLVTYRAAVTTRTGPIWLSR